jgi:muramidase (phage lysozyme)
MARIKAPQNICAFLDTIAWSEIGPALLKASDEGYNVLAGGKLFGVPPACYVEHPDKRVLLSNEITSTAAGRYQLLGRYFPIYKNKLSLPDFGPKSQDSIAIQQIKECDAYALILLGSFALAVKRTAHIWASFPGNSYNQRENTLDDLLHVYLQNNGTQEEIDDVEVK